MAVKSIDAHFAAILRDVRKHVKNASLVAAKKAQADIIKEANTYLDRYYANYKPKKYKRTYYLKNAIRPISAIKEENGVIKITIGVYYDANKLKGHYTSNSKWHQSGSTWKSSIFDEDFNFEKSDNGVPQPGWILDNYLSGSHGGYALAQDSESTESLMNEFLDKTLPNRMQEYIQKMVWHTFTSGL